MTRIKNNYNAHKFDSNYEINNGDSKTVPDQSMSLSEILRRFASGLPLGGQRVEFYEGEEDDILNGINPATLDLAEKQQITDSIKEELTEIQIRQAQRKKAKETFLQEAKWKKQQEKLNQPPKVLGTNPTEDQSENQS